MCNKPEECVDDFGEAVQALPAELFNDSKEDINDEEKQLEDRLNKLLSSSRTPCVNIQQLAPEKLMVIQIEINGQMVKALIDTGAQNNMIQDPVRKAANLQLDSQGTISMKGLGNGTVQSLGKVISPVSIHKIEFKAAEFLVIGSEIIEYPVVLGRKFLKDNKISVNMSANILSKRNSDNSRTHFHFSEKNGAPVRVIQEGVKVYLSQTVEVDSSPSLVPIEFKVFMHNETSDKLLFEPACKNSKVEGASGILDGNVSNGSVLLKTKIGEEPKQKLKKGSVVGTVCTMIELDEPDSKDDAWDIKDLKDKVSLENLSEDQKQLVYDALFRANTAFGKSAFDIGNAKVSPHVIELSNYTPIWIKPRHFPDPVSQEINRQCKELEANDIIEKCYSKWSAPVVPVRKTDGDLRLCVDYRKLNQVTKAEHFPIPNLSDSLYKGYNVKYFSKMDLIKGYYQVPIDENSRKFTAFSTLQDQYQFKRLSFGLKNSGIQFQKNMTEILSDFKHRRIIIYQDDILIMSETFEEHLELVEKILVALAKYGVKVKLDKCEFFKEQVTFLGHLINKNGIRKAPEFMDKIKNYPKPSNVTELRRFLGLANFQRKFLENFSTIARPLTSLTGGPKRKVLKWSEEMNESFEMLKIKLAEDMYLAFPDYSEQAQPLELYVDASEMGAGACLMQFQDGEYKNIAFSSLAFSKAEQKYSPKDRELLALRWGVKNFRSFLFGVKFTIYTDHKPLLYLKNMSNENARLMRTITDLEDYDFTIKYRPGVDNQAADSMSRIIPMQPDDDSRLHNTDELPKGLRLMQKIDGGGNSLFQSLLMVMEDNREEIEGDVPENHLELRKTLVEYILDNPGKFNLKLDKDTKKIIKSMRNEGVLPSETVLLAACCIFGFAVQVHHGMMSPILFKTQKIDDKCLTLHLQCLAGVHFNPVASRKSYVNFVYPKCVETTVDEIVETDVEVHEEDSSGTDVPNSCNVQTCNSKISECKCMHNSPRSMKQMFSLGDVSFCAIIDTGAEVCLLNESLASIFKAKNPLIQTESARKEVIGGIGNVKIPVSTIIHLKLELAGVEFEEAVPFAVVEDDAMPCCSIIGSNFIKRNKIIVDYDEQTLYAKGSDSKEIICPFDESTEDVYLHIDSVTMWDATSEDDVTDDSLKSNQPSKVRFRLSGPNDNLYDIQTIDHSVCELRKKVENGIHVKEWSEGFLKQFKVYHSKLCVVNGLLLKTNSDNSQSTVVPFPMLAEIILKTHVQLAHIGSLKLADIVGKKFWHPAIRKVAHDVCKSCPHCQIFKVSKIDKTPPTLKIQTNHPFEILSVDLMMLPKTPRQNTAVLVAIDQYSKWMSVIPLKDKKAKSVVEAMHQQVLPGLPRLPDKVLSDNGPEFKSSQFGEMLAEYGIKHILSTPYKPSSNGGVERSNRTIIQLLKGIVSKSSEWDTALPKTVIIYNSTIHSQTGMSPSDRLLKDAHKMENNLPIKESTASVWEAGHPKFSPYETGQKVLKQIQRTGNLLKNKLEPRFEGPYHIIKVQPNKLTYVIVKELGSSTQRELKVHYKQIKLFAEIPEYLRDYINFEPLKQINSPISEEDDSSDEELCGIFIPSSDTEEETFDEARSNLRSARLVINNSSSSTDDYSSSSGESTKAPDEDNIKPNELGAQGNAAICDNTLLTKSHDKQNHDEDKSHNEPEVYNSPSRYDAFNPLVRNYYHLDGNNKTMTLSDLSGFNEITTGHPPGYRISSTPFHDDAGSFVLELEDSERNESDKKRNNTSSIHKFFENLNCDDYVPVKAAQSDLNTEEKNFIDLMEKAWTMSINLVEEEIERETRDFELTMDQSNFDGFDSHETFIKLSNNRRLALEGLREQNRTSLQVAKQYRNVTEKVGENIEENQELGIKTRSKGKVKDLPHVLERPIEYKRYSNRRYNSD